MKIISWNCQGAFRNKTEDVLELLPDILVVQECECLDRLLFGSVNRRPSNFLWFGDNRHKGLGVFSYGDYRFSLLDCYNPACKMIVPIAVTGGRIDFNLFAIWANNPQDPDHRYVEQVWNAINLYDGLLDKGSSILMGDFNSNTIWDRKNRVGNHSAVVDRLADKHIFSCYHKKLNQEQGKEKDPTFFLQRNSAMPYHIDYCFVSADLFNRFQHVENGTYVQWITQSDYAPVIVEVVYISSRRNEKGTSFGCPKKRLDRMHLKCLSKD